MVCRYKPVIIDVHVGFICNCECQTCPSKTSLTWCFDTW